MQGETLRFRKWVLIFGLLFCAPAYAIEWADLWSTPEQRALKKLENKEYQELIESAPDANWRGLGEYRSGDYAAAAQSFAQQQEAADAAGQELQSERAKYNQANAQVRSENYDQAISLYDEILDTNPQHENAKHNREIVRQLVQQQQQQQQQQESGEQGEGEDSEQQQSESESEEQGSDSDEAQDSSEQDNQQSQDSQQQSKSSDSQDANQNDAQVAESDDEQARADEAAAQAMAAEQQREAEQQGDEEQGEQQAQATEEPLSEREQANEQWLRKIPDDPIGLLQRKLQNRHLTDFPQVKDSDKPW